MSRSRPLSVRPFIRGFEKRHHMSTPLAFDLQASGPGTWALFRYKAESTCARPLLFTDSYHARTSDTADKVDLRKQLACLPAVILTRRRGEGRKRFCKCPALPLQAGHKEAQGHREIAPPFALGKSNSPSERKFPKMSTPKKLAALKQTHHRFKFIKRKKNLFGLKNKDLKRHAAFFVFFCFLILL